MTTPLLTRQQLLDSIHHECSIIRHLGAKVEGEHLSYRPTEGQRSLQELLEYLTYCAVVPTRYCLTNNWDHSEQYAQQAVGVALSEFEERMLRQEEEIIALVSSFGDDDWLRPTAMPWGSECRLGEGLVNMPLKVLVAYRMQLFLYLKACGVAIGPPNCWVGMDP